MAAGPTAEWIEKALRGQVPVPEPILTQVRCLKALVAR
jgi:hypothetical protein